MGAAPNYFATMKAEVGRIVHSLNNAVAIAANNARFLAESGIPMTADQESALRDTADSSERSAALLRELQVLIG